MSEYTGYREIKGITKRLPTDVFCQDADDISLDMIESRINEAGVLLRKEPGELTALIKAGAADMNFAVVVAKSDASTIHLASYAKEGLINQHTAKKAIDKILEP